MKLSEICIDRPVFATVLSLLIVLFGLIGITRLPNRELPNIDPPLVSVTTIFPGAAPEVVETSVTEPIEDLLIGIEGVKHLTSQSREQVSLITVEFELSRDVDIAANDVRDRVARVRRDLPDDVEDPIVAKQDADARPIVWIALSGGRDQIELTRIAENQIQDRLAKLPGVATVFLGGERRMAMRIWINNERLISYGLTVADIVDALERENVDIPSGRIEGDDREFTVRTLGELTTAEEFEQLIVADLDGEPIRLRDIANVAVGPEDERKLTRFNGEPTIGLGVVKLAQANTIAVVDSLEAELAQLETELPEQIDLTIAFDSSEHIRESINDVVKTLIVAVILVLIVIYLFLRTVRATLIPAISIPVSIVGTLAVLYFAGFSINILTLMGLTLAIGLVVDDAIIVLENIARWVEDGAPPREAAIRGMREISFAVVVSTIAVIAVFLPLTFLTDTTGRLFREFGVTVASAVAISGFVALTMAPMLCSRILRPRREEHGVKAGLARFFERLAGRYESVLRPSLRFKWITLAIGLAWFFFGVSLLFWGDVKREFVPRSDRGSMWVFTRAPEGSTIDYTHRFQKQVEDIVMKAPEVESVFSVVALGINAPGLVNEGAVITGLRKDRKRSTADVIQSLLPEFMGVTGLSVWPSEPPSLGQGWMSQPVSVVIQGPDVETLAAKTNAIIARISKEVPGLRGPRSDLVLNKPQLDVTINRNRAADLGVSVRDVATTLQIMLGGQDISTFKLDGQTYDVIVQLMREKRTRARDIRQLYVHGKGGRLVALTSVVSVADTNAPRAVPHHDRVRSATIMSALAPGTPLGATLDSIREIAEEELAGLPGYHATFSGESEDFYESTQAIIFAYLLAILIIYLVLAAQFESFVHPFTILTAVALSFTGALVTIKGLDLLAGALGAPQLSQSLNLFSQIGMVMLVGLVTKNAILIVEFANQLRERGKGVYEAAFEAARTRFRPILMTALSTIMGLLPIALGGYRVIAQAIGIGAGGELRAPLGIAVVGGMFFSTIFTIFVVPATYLVVEAMRERSAKRRAQRREAEERAPAGAPAA